MICIPQSKWNVLLSRRKVVEMFKVNIRAVYGMKSIEVGHTPLKRKCLYTNMPEPKGNDNNNDIAKTVRDATKVVAEQSNGRLSKRSERRE